MKNNNKGMTLIELIVAIAILSLIVVAFLNMFVFGFTQITRAGNKSSADFLVQQAIEQSLAGAAVDPQVSISPQSTLIVIQLPVPPSPAMSQSGNEVTVSQEVNGNVSEFKVFVP